MKNLILFCLSISLNYLQAQDTTTVIGDTSATVIPDMKLIAGHFGDSVVLRWAPTHIGAWIDGNNHGYQIYKMPMDTTLPDQELQLKPIQGGQTKAMNGREWMEYGKREDDEMALLAGEFYLSIIEDFRPDPSTSLLEKFYQGKELKERYTLMLLAADQSPTAADALGMRFVDYDVKAGKDYYYLVELNVQDTSFQGEIFSAGNITNRNYNKVAPIPEKIYRKEKQIDFLISRTDYNGLFSSFYIFKSEDGKNFEKTTNAPIVNPLEENEAIGNLDYYVLIDKVVDNYKSYYYKIAGVTPFGTLTPFTPVYKLNAVDKTPPPIPNGVTVAEEEVGQLTVRWNYPDTVGDLRGFKILRSKKPYEKGEEVHEGWLDPDTRLFMDKNPRSLAANFYNVYAVDTSGNVNFSLATYGHMVDSFPPAPPEGLIGSIDTNGVVNIEWNLGKEEDLFGYQVFFANADYHEYSNATRKIIQDTFYTDTITLKTLTEEIYFKVVAFDFNYNASAFSEPLKLQKPDIIPPAPSFIHRIEVLDSILRIHVTPSSSKDLVSYQLLRKKPSQDAYKVVQTISSDGFNAILLEKNLEPNTYYDYTIVAEDDAGLSSPIAFWYTTKTARKINYGSIENLNIELNKKIPLIAWNYSGPDEDVIKIYKSVDGRRPFTLLETINADDETYIDRLSHSFEKIEYKLLLCSPDGLVKKNYGLPEVTNVSKD